MPSSVIQAMRYEPRWRQLLIVFRGGRGIYRYFDVPVEEWRAFLEAESKGMYLNEVFKRKGHRYERVTEPIWVLGQERAVADEPLEWGAMLDSRKMDVVRVEDDQRWEENVRA